MPKFDTDVVRQAAAGHWLDLLASIAGIDSALLDGQHHACPKCGGTDRFRLVDESAGAVLCNQCFAKRNGDGFSAIMWATGCTFPDALGKVAAHLGLKPAKGSRAKVDPEKDLKWMDWSSELAAMYCAHKPGVTEAAILAAGGRMARYKRTYTVIAFPIIGETLDALKPVGWLLVNATGSTLPKFDKTGEIVGAVDKKITYGSKPGLIGLHAIERLKLTGMVDVCWKTEGLTDLLAVMAAIPATLADRQVAVTNSNGAKQGLGWMAGVLSRVRTHVLHDCDEPGQVGAAKAVQEIAAQGGEPRNVVLPYAIEPSHGKDVRDWLGEGNTYSDLVAMAEHSAPVRMKTTAAGDRDYSESTWPVQEQILRKLQIEVLYEAEDGRIRIYSWAMGKSAWITPGELDRMKKPSMIRKCGPPAMMAISRDPDNETCWSMEDVSEAIALTASGRREQHNERGVGVWRGKDEQGGESDVLILVNGKEAARLVPGGELERITTPRLDGLVLNLGSGFEDWYEFDDLSRYVREASDHKWCEDVLEVMQAIFARWNWPNPESDPQLLTGLVVATWVQTIWKWRPLVSVIGKTNSGKSILFDALGGKDSGLGIFNKLALLTSKSTEAGIRQGIGSTGKVVLCDEFEDCRDRERILEMLRASTRGSAVSRGTSDQRGQSFTLRHLVWVAATESGLKKQPDLNRFIQFCPLEAEQGKFGHLTPPESQVLSALGQKLLAIALVHGPVAAELAVRLKKTRVDGIDARVIESYSVPAAILTRACGGSDEDAATTLRELLASVDRDEQGKGDGERLIDDILAAQINCGAVDGYLTVAQIVSDAKRWETYRDRVEATGLTYYFTEDEFGDVQSYLVIAQTKIGRTILRDTDWKTKKLSDILKNLKGVKAEVRKIARVSTRCKIIPIEVQRTGTTF